MAIAEQVRFRYSDVEVTCHCGCAHGLHFDLRENNRYAGTGCDGCNNCVSLRWQSPSVAPQPEPVFGSYRRVMREQVQLPPSQWTFKRDPRYTQFLEHVLPQQGEAYLAWLRQRPYWTAAMEATVRRTAAENDQFGAPLQHSSDLGILCSPTNLRYAWQAAETLAHAKALHLPTVRVFEVGGGYGGLALYLQRLARAYGVHVAHHTIVDVPEAGPLVDAYVKALGVKRVSTVNGTSGASISLSLRGHTRGERLFVSVYAFSEINAELRAWYEQTLTSRIPHGWVVWNRVAPYALAPGDMTIEDEPVPTEPGVKVTSY